MDVESTAEADGDGSHLATMSAKGKNNAGERAAEGTAARENGKGERQG